MRGGQAVIDVRHARATLARHPFTAMKHAVRAVLQRTLLVVADRWNYFLVRGMYHPNSRFNHRAFLGGSDWGKSRDMVRFATVDLLRREIAEWGVDGAVAELGVGVGTFAAMLNHYFPERTIYLFDTFAGFDARDLAAETTRGRPGVPYGVTEVAVEEVRSRLPYPEKAEFRVGFSRTRPRAARAKHSAWSMSTSASTNPPTPVCGGSIRAWLLVGICS